MKKVFASFCLAAAFMGLSSCASGNKADIKDLNGVWNIVEINGIAVTPASAEETPFIGFNAETRELHGSTGCNSLLGTFSMDEQGVLDFSGMGSTKMMCADMTLEDNLLSAMGAVKTFKKLDADNLALCGADDSAVVVLKKR